MLSLPMEVQNHIFEYLDQKSLESVSRVCKKYESMCTLIWLRALNKPPFRDPPKDTSPLGVRTAIIRYYKDYNETFRFLWEISREKKNCFHEKSECEEKIYLLKKKIDSEKRKIKEWGSDFWFYFSRLFCVINEYYTGADDKRISLHNRRIQILAEVCDGFPERIRVGMSIGALCKPLTAALDWKESSLQTLWIILHFQPLIEEEDLHLTRDFPEKRLLLTEKGLKNS